MKSLTRLLLLGSCLALSSTAWSIPLTAFGKRDTLIGQFGSLHSGAIPGVSLDNFNYTRTDGGSPDTHFLFDNSNLFAVIDLVSMGFSQRNISNIGKISHIAAGPAVTTVPESNSLALIGLGVLGLTLLRRRSAQPITK